MPELLTRNVTHLKSLSSQQGHTCVIPLKKKKDEMYHNISVQIFLNFYLPFQKFPRKFIDNGEGKKGKVRRKDQRIGKDCNVEDKCGTNRWTLSSRCKRGLLPRQSFHSIPTTMFRFLYTCARKFRPLHIKAPPPFNPLPFTLSGQ